jgi:hypothetical protein
MTIAMIASTTVQVARNVRNFIPPDRDPARIRSIRLSR